MNDYSYFIEEKKEDIDRHVNNLMEAVHTTSDSIEEAAKALEMFDSVIKKTKEHLVQIGGGIVHEDEKIKKIVRNILYLQDECERLQNTLNKLSSKQKDERDITQDYPALKPVDIANRITHILVLNSRSRYSRTQFHEVFITGKKI